MSRIAVTCFTSRYHKGLRHGSGVYKFKGLPPGGTAAAAAASNADVEPDAEAAEAVGETKTPEGGLYIGEWNTGFMQGLGILKYDDGER